MQVAFLPKIRYILKLDVRIQISFPATAATKSSHWWTNLHLPSDLNTWTKQEIPYGNDPNPATKIWPLKTGQKNKQVTPAEKVVGDLPGMQKDLFEKGSKYSGVKMEQAENP